MDATPTLQANQQPHLYGLLVEFNDPDTLLSAAAKVRDAGYTQWDSYTPFPVHGLDRAMGVKPTPLPFLVLGAGLTGGAMALFFQRWFNAVDYPQVFSGKPFWSLPPNIPVGFELTILFSALTAFFGLWTLIGLPKLYHPLFNSERFRRVTDDGFFIAIEAADPKFNAQKTAELLHSLGGIAVEEVKD